MIDEKSLERTEQRVKTRLSELVSFPSKKSESEFRKRLDLYLRPLIQNLFDIYQNQPDLYHYIEKSVVTAAEAWSIRPQHLKKRDYQREKDPTWYKSNKMVGAVCYVDLFAGTLQGIEEKIPYLKELGISYLHLMPLFKMPENENDGGYAVSSYREVDPGLGSMAELSTLAKKLHSEGINLVLDFVNNHTSNEHEWAKKARSGDPFYKEFYYFYPNRFVPDQYERTLREIFPEVRRGSFTQLAETGEWVWTTFHSYQWDLNYKNPEVFVAIAQEMLFLANIGVDVLRMDAVPFTWKEIGTTCENLPQAHSILKALNAIIRMASPALIFKSEAIVHPDEVARYISPEECQISYNPTVMALLWEALATREVKLLKKSLALRYAIHEGSAWVNYVRSHDDIGWTFSDDDARELGIDPFGHRMFLNHFYGLKFEGSFAKGLPFQHNPETRDLRVCGTTASLAGLELAYEKRDEGYREDAIKRILLIYSVVISLGGIPLIYLGDEIGTMNDYSFTDDPEKKEDSRWVHRVAMDWDKATSGESQSVAERLKNALTHRIRLRKEIPAFGNGDIQVIETTNEHVLGYLKNDDTHRLILLYNFSEEEQKVQANFLEGTDLLTGNTVNGEHGITMSGYECLWIAL